MRDLKDIKDIKKGGSAMGMQGLGMDWRLVGFMGCSLFKCGQFVMFPILSMRLVFVNGRGDKRRRERD